MKRTRLTLQKAAELQNPVVEIPTGYTTMDEGIFQKDQKLQKVLLPDTMLAVSENAFSECKNLQEVGLNKGLKKIKQGAFQKSTLREIGIPQSVEKLEKDAFYHCNYMTDAAFMGYSRCHVIPMRAFGGCTRLEWITLPQALERIEACGFYKDKGLDAIELPDTLRYIGERAFYFTALKEAQIPEQVTYIGDEAFRNSHLEGVVTLPKGLKYLGHYAFSGIDELKVLEIPESVEFIGEHTVNQQVQIRCIRGSAAENYAVSRGMQVLQY